MNFQNTMYNRYLSSFYSEDHYFPHSNRVIHAIGQEKQVSSVECGLHAATGGKIK